MNQVGIILAAPTLSYEPELVRLAQGSGLPVIRRPLDAAELLGVASIEPATPVVMGIGLPRCDAAVVELLQRGHRQVFGIATTSDEHALLSQMGITCVLEGATPEIILAELLTCVEFGGNHPQPLTIVESRESMSNGVWSTGAWAPTSQEVNETEFATQKPIAAVITPHAHSDAGQVIAVWGPQGAPGRTLTALALSRLLASMGKRVCLIDADTVAPALTMLTGIVEDASGIVVACRYAQRGSLTEQSLVQLARPIDRHCWLIGGISHPDRWEELDARTLKEVLKIARASFDYVVLDVGFGVASSLESNNLFELPRYLAASSALAQADAVVAVTQSSALGMSRLLQHLSTVQSQVTGSLAIAIREVTEGNSHAAIQGLRAYGVQQEILELPDLQAFLSPWTRTSRSRSGLNRKKKNQWRHLEQWCARLDQGEGKTTIKVPTLANL
jgi:MinD-like ATPase involved in chromosome partitioning or flagellar assembly